MRRVNWAIVAAAVAAATWGVPSRAVMMGQTTTFQSGTLEGWGSGSANPNPPSVLADAGPAGAGDFAMLVIGNGAPAAPGGRMVAFNNVDWTGDYLEAGILAITLDVANTSSENITIRLNFEGNGGHFTSVEGVEVPALSHWRTITLPIGISDLTGGFDYFQTMGEVLRFWITHNTTSVHPPSAFAGTMVIDNITATPEPTSLALLAMGGVALARRRRARAGR